MTVRLLRVGTLGVRQVRWRLGGETLLLAALLIFIAALSLAPILRLAMEALAPDGALDLGRILRVFAPLSVWRAAFNTLKMAAGAAVLATVVGTLMATVVGLTDLRGRAPLVFCFVLPLMIPPQVSTLAWINLFGPASAVLGLIGLAPASAGHHPLQSLSGMIFILGLHNAPLVFLTVRPAIRAVPADLVEAARSQGASQRRAFFNVVLPLAAPGIVSGAALAFVGSAGNFAIPALLGIPGRVPTLITVIYQRLADSGQDALADVALLSFSLAIIAVLGLVVQGWLLRRRDVRMSGLSAAQFRFRLGRWRRPLQTLMWLMVGGVLFAPLVALLSTALVSGYGQALTAETLTFKNFNNALFEQTMIRGAFLTSLWLSAATAGILVLMAVPFAFFVVRRPGALVRVGNSLLEIGYVLPGTVVAIAAILLFLKPLPLIRFSLYGTPWIILAAYLTNRSILALRPVIGRMAQLDRALDEAAAVVGASFLRRLWDITVPLVAPAAIAGGMLVFMTALTEIQVSVLLVSSSTRTIGAAVYFLEEGGATTLAAAVGILLVIVVFLLMLAMSLLRRRLPAGVLPWSD
jgi:iron(III) transport system permease protein